METVYSIFPEDKLLRAAAILHDTGHVPFSHSVEKALGFDHHQLTEAFIATKEISLILEEAGLSSRKVIDYLNQRSPLTGGNGVLGIDHLDSFIRDTYMNGKVKFLPKDVLPQLECTEQGIQTNEKLAIYLTECILNDHKLFLSPELIGIDRLVEEALRLHWSEEDVESKDQFAKATDAEVLVDLMNSPSNESKRITKAILYQPEELVLGETGLPIKVKKVYVNVPLVAGKKITEISEEAKNNMEELQNITYSLKVSI